MNTLVLGLYCTAFVLIIAVCLSIIALFVYGFYNLFSDNKQVEKSIYNNEKPLIIRSESETMLFIAPRTGC